MFARKIRTPLFLLMFAAIPVSHSLAQRSPEASASERNVSRRVPAPPILPAGRVITTFLTNTLTSRHNQVGEHVIARIAHPVVDAAGEVVIPADAIVLGVISDIASKDDGRIVLTFYSVAFGGNTYPMQARVISLPTRKQRRGNTAGDAAKVGAGGLLGGIAGRLIGGNKKGTIIGAVSGVAAGAGVAAATRNEDIVVDAGAPVLLMLIAPLVL